METKIVDKKIDYDGGQLRSHWILDNFGIYGDAMVAFEGACNVQRRHMVDLEDLNSNSSIYSENMLHFIVEHFDISLKEAVFRQRILICIIKEVFEEVGKIVLTRNGDDLFDEESKISISVATISPVSGLIHVGLNISSKNTPVLTKGLQDYKIETRLVSLRVFEKYKEELLSLIKSISKVRWVK